MGCLYAAAAQGVVVAEANPELKRRMHGEEESYSGTGVLGLGDGEQLVWNRVAEPLERRRGTTVDIEERQSSARISGKTRVGFPVRPDRSHKVGPATLIAALDQNEPDAIGRTSRSGWGWTGDRRTTGLLLHLTLTRHAGFGKNSCVAMVPRDIGQSLQHWRPNTPHSSESEASPKVTRPSHDMTLVAHNIIATACFQLTRS